jgi:hypothetical protein
MRSDLIYSSIIPDISECLGTTLKNCLTIDVEDYFQVNAFAAHVRQDQWDSFPLRVGDNTHRILDIQDSYNIKATFFVLGWVAERLPTLAREITSAAMKSPATGMGMS